MPNRANGTETLYVEVPPSLKFLVDDDDRTNKEVVITALERELGVNAADSVAIVKRKIRRKEQLLQEEQEAAREARDRLGNLKDDLDELRSIRESKADEEGNYEDQLDTILDEMVAGDLQQVDSHHPTVDTIRKEFDRPSEEVHYDLMERAAEVERDLLNTRFMDLRRAEQVERRGEAGPIADTWGGEDS